MRTRALISQSALTHNLSVVRQLTPGAKVVSMVKANAYGHHLDCVQPLIDGSDMLAVSELSEATKLRAITDRPILLLSGTYSESELQRAIDLNCHIVVHHISQIPIINNSKQMVSIWLKIDTGMHRLGLSADEYRECLSLLDRNSLVEIACAMSHFACADEIGHPMNKSQLNSFQALTSKTDSRSMANSAAILSQAETAFDFVRPGIMLYGASPFNTPNNQLKPVMKLSAPIVSIKTLKIGESVGYGATWTADKDMTLAVVGVGYGDGYPRHARNGTPVLINGVLCPLIGRVSMDLICVDISTTKSNVGDSAILWGDVQLPIEVVANNSNTISYELLTGLSTRVNFELAP
ncbi:MAG: alanine racemase [Candidatus Thioglobus sp.]|nr:alanine racemase [Candidatus Thioglobus sp.]